MQIRKGIIDSDSKENQIQIISSTDFMPETTVTSNCKSINAVQFLVNDAGPNPYKQQSKSVTSLPPRLNRGNSGLLPMAYLKSLEEEKRQLNLREPEIVVSSWIDMSEYSLKMYDVMQLNKSMEGQCKKITNETFSIANHTQ